VNRFLVFVILILASFPSSPSQTSNYSVPSYVTVKSNNIAIVWFAVSLRTGVIPSCATDTGGGGYYALAFSLSTDAGKAMFSELLAARTLGPQGLWAVGTGDCGVLGGTESLSMLIGPPGSIP
jgi:hypothetical protein